MRLPLTGTQPADTPTHRLAYNFPMPPASYGLQTMFYSHTFTGPEVADAGAAEDTPTGAAKGPSKEVIGLTADSTLGTDSAPAALAVHKAEDDVEMRAPRVGVWTALLCLMAIAQARPDSTFQNWISRV